MAQIRFPIFDSIKSTVFWPSRVSDVHAFLFDALTTKTLFLPLLVSPSSNGFVVTFLSSPDARGTSLLCLPLPNKRRLRWTSFLHSSYILICFRSVWDRASRDVVLRSDDPSPSVVSDQEATDRPLYNNPYPNQTFLFASHSKINLLSAPPDTRHLRMNNFCVVLVLVIILPLASGFAFIPSPQPPTTSLHAKVKLVNGAKSFMAAPGSKMSAACSKLGIKPKYSCKKGDCGSCTVSVGGSRVKACVGKVRVDIYLHV